MAEAVISVVFETFVSRSLEKIEKEVRLVKNAKKDVEKLKKSLRLIQALLEDAAKKEIESKSVKEWLSGLEEISYDMDDLMDEWNNVIQKDEKKVCLPMPSCLCFQQNVRLRGFAKKINELIDELDGIKKEGNDLGIVARVIEPSHHDHQNGTTSAIKHRMTTSFVDEAKVHGRDEEKEALLSMLVSENSSNHKGKRIEIVAIVGFGGLGKTTLAQIVYNHDSVKAHFDTRIWVCVSRPFDLFKITKAIVKELGGNPQIDEELEALMRSISESIRGKKFLIVLDDVWSEDEETWDQLNQALQSRGIGSKMLVTTRNMQVAKMMRVNTDKIVSPRSLSDEQCWSIIRQLTFVEEEKSNEFTRELALLGKKISAKCKGSPLIAKILGSHMWLNKSKAKWESILYNQLWELTVVDHIFSPLLLSYYDLSSSEKCCLSYCSVFPEDHIIQPDMLIEMWMSQGYFNDISKGQDCFERLVQRSFFQEFKMNEYNGTIEFCKMHDVVYDFVCYLTKGKCLVMKGALIGETFESLDEKTRHLTLLLDAPDQFSHVLKCNHEKSKIANQLRTLVITGSNFEIDAKLLSLPCLRTWSNLYLTFLDDIKFPHNLPMFIHFRYLDISYTRELKELPASVCDLYNLQTLRMNGCYMLQCLPEGIGKLVNLRHLYVNGCDLLRWFPKGMKKLTCLEKLDVLMIPENKETCFNVDDFNELRSFQFRGNLLIKGIGNFGSVNEAEKVNLIYMEDLHTLELVFAKSYFLDDNVNEVEDTFLEALKPHLNLKKLWIGYYCGSAISPSWITSLTNLREIDIYLCKFCEILPALGKLPSLESLTIAHMKRMKKVGLELLGITPRNDASLESSFVLFSKLKKLSFRSLWQWQEWEGINIATNSSLKIMPLLQTLEISECPSLVALPDFLQMVPLQDLFINYCKSLEEWCWKETGIEWLKNSQIKNVRLKNVSVGSGCLIRNGIWNINC